MEIEHYLYLSMIYPVYEVHEKQGIISRISLPKNFKELVKNFYQERKKPEFEDYVKKIEERFTAVLHRI